MSKSKKRRLQEQALAQAAPKSSSQAKTKPKGSSGKSGSGKGSSAKVPQEVFDHVKANANGKCPFWNIGKCKFGDSCKDAHACTDCGGPRTYLSAHHPRN